MQPRAATPGAWEDGLAPEALIDKLRPDRFTAMSGKGEVGANDLIGEEADLNRNLLTLIGGLPLRR